MFIAFLSMVTWGLLVGLVLLPVILSICGPMVTVTTASPVEPKVDLNLMTIEDPPATTFSISSNSHESETNTDLDSTLRPATCSQQRMSSFESPSYDYPTAPVSPAADTGGASNGISWLAGELVRAWSPNILLGRTNELDNDNEQDDDDDDTFVSCRSHT